MVEETLVTVGAVVSMTIFLLKPSDPCTPAGGSVRIALFPPASLIVPPAREIVGPTFRSELFSPGPTLYVKVSVLVPVPEL